MAATRLELPDELKKRIDLLVARARKTPHACMQEVPAREVERAELRERFPVEAAESEQEALAGGETSEILATFDYLEEGVAGTKARRPKARVWRASK